MKAATVRELKQELSYLSQSELLELCLRLAKFKKENKELLTYLLYEAENEDGYIVSVQREIDEQFELININSYYYIKKSVRKILRAVKKYIRYSKQDETEVELLLYFCTKLSTMNPSIKKSLALYNIYKRQLVLVEKTICKLHEDLQHDYKLELQELLN